MVGTLVAQGVDPVVLILMTPSACNISTSRLIPRVQHQTSCCQCDSPRVACMITTGVLLLLLLLWRLYPKTAVGRSDMTTPRQGTPAGGGMSSTWYKPT
jgi:hypothetical protein